jgi:hypothetical protein
LQYYKSKANYGTKKKGISDIPKSMSGIKLFSRHEILCLELKNNVFFFMKQSVFKAKNTLFYRNLLEYSLASIKIIKEE